MSSAKKETDSWIAFQTKQSRQQLLLHTLLRSTKRKPISKTSLCQPRSGTRWVLQQRGLLHRCRIDRFRVLVSSEKTWRTCLASIVRQPVQRRLKRCLKMETVWGRIETLQPQLIPSSLVWINQSVPDSPNKTTAKCQAFCHRRWFSNSRAGNSRLSTVQTVDSFYRSHSIQLTFSKTKTRNSELAHGKSCRS
jgi:hypothetical protein